VNEQEKQDSSQSHLPIGLQICSHV